MQVNQYTLSIRKQPAERTVGLQGAPCWKNGERLPGRQYEVKKLLKPARSSYIYRYILDNTTITSQETIAQDLFINQ